MNNTLLSVCLAGVCVSFLSGCATYNDSRSSTQERENLLLLREDINWCKSHIETVEIEQQRLHAEMAQLRSFRGPDEGSQARMDELERRITALDAARAHDRQAIIDQLSGNVAKMISASPSPSKTSKSASSSATGYEHIVKGGETLSAIAAAYKVKPSAIIEANDLKKPDALRAGQKLFIPQ